MSGVVEYLLATGQIPVGSDLDGIRYVLASGLNDEGEVEVHMDQLQELMDAVKADNAAWNEATHKLRQSLIALHAAIEAILEGLSGQ